MDGQTDEGTRGNDATAVVSVRWSSYLQPGCCQVFGAESVWEGSEVENGDFGVFLEGFYEV